MKRGLTLVTDDKRLAEVSRERGAEVIDTDQLLSILGGDELTTSITTSEHSRQPPNSYIWSACKHQLAIREINIHVGWWEERVLSIHALEGIVEAQMELENLPQLGTYELVLGTGMTVSVLPTSEEKEY